MLEPRVVARDPLAGMIDHTLLKAEATPAMVDHLCTEAAAYQFASVCVNSAHVARCASNLEGTGVAVCAVAGFPLGSNLPEVKAFEAQRAIALGASEIDIVMNVGALKAADYGQVADDIAGVADVCHGGGAKLKVILETCLLDDLEKVVASLLAMRAGADYVKTSTGMSTGGATLADVMLMRHAVGPNVGVKAAGGIRTYAQAIAMVTAGATRIGASAGVAIVSGAPV
ncbi:MAG: deoxyribose-phosphate aldolase [Anaerolineae bacterium]